MSQKKCREKDLVNIQLLTCKVGLTTKAMALQLGYSFNRGFLKYLPLIHWHTNHQAWMTQIIDSSV